MGRGRLCSKGCPAADLDIGLEQEDMIPASRIEEAVSTEEIPDVEEEEPRPSP